MESCPGPRAGVRGLDRAEQLGPVAGPVGHVPARTGNPALWPLPWRAAGAAGGLRAEPRDAASGELAFELAGRLQAEIEALDWVTAQQRVARPGTGDCTAYGWADGL